MRSPYLLSAMRQLQLVIPRLLNQGSHCWVYDMYLFLKKTFDNDIIYVLFSLMHLLLLC